MESIVLISSDCLHHDRCGYDGHPHPTTPFLNQLAGNSIVFDNAYAAGPFITESVQAFIGGQQSFKGYHFNSDAWPPADFWYPFGEREQVFRHFTDRGGKNPLDVGAVSE